MRKTFPKKLALIILLPLGMLLSELAANKPVWVERVYSQRIYFAVNQVLSRFTSIFTFSLAEMLLLFFIIVVVISVVRAVSIIVKEQKRWKKAVIQLVTNALVFISISYFVFNLLWGLNYYRLPFSDIAGLDVSQSASTKELEELCRSLIELANSLRGTLEEDSNGVMRLKDNRSDVFATATKGFKQAAAIYPELGGNYGRAKKVLLSELLSYTGITGVYFPFTGEANINNSIPAYMLPSTICHEMAHQRGFAREDEANYIAYLTSILHPDTDFQYSGTLLALIYSINSLYQNDPVRALQLREEYSEGLKRDLADWSRFWQKYEGPVEKISREVNDTYLKANRQEDGVNSYDRMVHLLLAEFRLIKK